jgi:Predicted membrane protein (DUF2232)
MVQIVLIGFGAGIASALLFAALASGSVLSIALFYLAPLPIMLAAVAWNQLAGLVATGVAATALGLFLGKWFFIAHLVGIGLPSYTLAYLALLARPGANPGEFEWYPAERLVLWSALIAAGVTVLAIPAFGLDLDSYRAALKAGFERVLRVQGSLPAGEPLRLPGGGDPGRVLDFLTLVIPPMAAVLSMLTSLINLWLAGRIARLSGRLTRPWPDLSAMRFPPSSLALLLGAVAGSFLPELVGLAAGLLAATLFTAFAILGFAVIHGVTRAFPGRPIILTAVWAAVLVIGWPALLVIMIGLADPLVDFRARAARWSGPKLPTTPPKQ